MNEQIIDVWQLSKLSNISLYEVYDEEKKQWVAPAESCYLEQGAGYAPIDDPFNAITSITVYLNWLNQLITLAIPPKTLNLDQAQEIGSKFDNTFIFGTESEMLNTFLDLIEDCDVISGWNSEGFDLPYIVNRIARIMSKDDTRRLCLWGERPKVKKVEKYGKEISTYELVGRVHLDLMSAYIKFSEGERHSYALNAIAELELNSHKTPYEGSLDTLYNNDFEKFLEYNRQDVMLLFQLENKLGYLALLYQLTQDATVLLPTAMGTVQMVDNAIVNRAHDLGMIVPNKKKHIDNLEEDAAAGAYVAYPKVGLHDWVGVIDINSLYPSTIRALNMGIETIVGQIRPILTDSFIKEKMKIKGMTISHSWEEQFGTQEYQAVMAQKPGIDITIDWEENGKSDTLTTKQCHDLIFNSGKKWMLSGNGTIFSYERMAIIPDVLTHWYKERKTFQKKKADSINDEDKGHYERLQKAAKTRLNATYGSLLSPSFRFHDKRVGQSVTLSGRIIAKHMNSFINESITGVYDYKGDSIEYVDTDSSQFSAWPVIKPLVESGQMEWNREIAVKLYLALGDKVNESFTPFMAKAFNCSNEYGSLIHASCESVATKALYITKKRYAMTIYYLDGKWYPEDKPKLKAMGLDLKRSDTPEICQKFLSEILIDMLKGGTDDDLVKKINDFRDQFKMLPLHEQGTPKRVNKLTFYDEQIKHGKGNRVPGHVRAAINWNNLRKLSGDNVHSSITDGMKILVCPLKPNQWDMTSIAYPIDEAHLPEWFTKLPFDTDSMIAAVVDKKISNLFGKLPQWKSIEERTRKINSFNDFFD